MPSARSPGVYIEETASGVHTIVGVGTSVAAFVGYTERGPMCKGVQIFGFADYERTFGGLNKDSPLSYAVQQFFQSGGTEAWIVRIAAGAAQRFDPYKNFKFRIKWDGRYVAGFTKVGGLERSSRRSRGRTKYDAITLERGVTHDTDFENWANKVWDSGAGPGSASPRRDLRKDIRIEVYNEAGRLTLAYKIHRCWVSEYQALPDLDANANAVVIEHLKLENEGRERDDEVPEPAERRRARRPR